MFPPYQAIPVGDEIRDLSFAARNEVVSIPAFSKVPCILGGTHNGTTTPLETDYIDVVVVENGKDFKDFQAINDLNKYTKRKDSIQQHATQGLVRLLQQILYLRQVQA